MPSRISTRIELPAHRFSSFLHLVAVFWFCVVDKDITRIIIVW